MEAKRKDVIKENEGGGGGKEEEERTEISKEVKNIMKSGDVPIVLGLERHTKMNACDDDDDDDDESDYTESTESNESGSESNESGSESSESESENESESSETAKSGERNESKGIELNEIDGKEKEKSDEDSEKEILGYATININEWFKHIVGKDEKELRETIDKENCPFECECIQEESPVPRRYTSVKIRNLSDPSKVFDAGLLYSTTVSKLKNVVVVGNEQKRAEGKLNTYKPPLTFEYADDQESRKYVDVSLLQSNPENAGSMFQVASNFNGVEGISELTPPDNPLFVTKYINDQTQGPAASISAGPAAIARVFVPFYPLGPGKKPREWQQTRTRQLNFLDELSDYYHVENGYVINGPRQKPVPEDPKAAEALVGKARVLVHADVDAVFGRRGCGTLEVLEAPVKISQVFCSSMNMAQGPTGTNNAKLPGAAAKARLLLRAAYLGTYFAAIDRGCTKLYLTLIGGGVFGNKVRDIFDVIADTHKKVALNKKYNSCIKEVHLPLFSVPPCMDDVIEDLKKKKFPFVMIKHTKDGSVVVNSTHHKENLKDEKKEEERVKEDEKVKENDDNEKKDEDFKEERKSFEIKKEEIDDVKEYAKYKGNEEKDEIKEEIKKLKRKGRPNKESLW